MFNCNNIAYDFETDEVKLRLKNFLKEFLELADKYQIDGYIEAGAIPNYDDEQDDE